MTKSILGWFRSRRMQASRVGGAVRHVVEQLESRQLLTATLNVVDSVPPTDDWALTLANTQVGSTSPQETFTLQNTGDTALTISNYTVVGNNPGDFDVAVKDNNGGAVDTSQNFVIPAGTSFEVDVDFAPTVAGNRSASIQFASDDPTNLTNALTISGVANNPPATTAPAAPTAGWAKVISSGQIRVYWTDNANNEDGFKLWRATAAGGPFTLKATLPANTTFYNHLGLAANTHYYYRVMAYNNIGTSTYTSANATTTADLGGNSVASATNLGTLTAVKAIRDFIGVNDVTDYYKFTMAYAGTARINVTELLDDLDVKLFKYSAGKLTQIGISENSDTNPENIAVAVPAGTYYVQLYQGYSGSNSSYRLLIDPDYAGNTRATARNIGVLTAAKSYSAYLGAIDTDDYYKFTLASTKSVTLNLTGLATDMDLYLLNGSGTQIGASENSGTASETITKSLGAGTYYVHVLYYSGAGSNYKLALSVK